MSANSNTMGATTYLKYTISWPYNSGSNHWDKIAITIDGGATCCQSYSSLASFSDNYNSYTALWINTKANTSVYQMIGRSSGTSITFRFNNARNPNPVDYATYEQGKKASIKLYSVFKTYKIYDLTQPNYSAYSKRTDFQVDNSPGYVTGSKPYHFPSHQNYPLTYEFYHNIGANSYNNRNISYIIVYFTSGMKSI